MADRFESDSGDRPINFDTLLGHLKDAYRLLYAAYQDIAKNRKDTPYEKPEETKTWHIENIITEELVDLAEAKTEEENLPFDWVNESKDLKNKSRIDIDIIYQSGLGKSKRLGIECKYFINNDSNRKYVKDGIKRFQTAYYAAKMPIAGMLGYIEEGKVDDIVVNINNKLGEEQQLESFTFSKELEKLNTYCSKHDRSKVPNCIANFKLYHLFLDFKGLIKREKKNKKA